MGRTGCNAVRQNDYEKLPLSEFCESRPAAGRRAAAACHVWHPGYSREIAHVEPPARRDRSRFRFLTVTNSHDLGRYNTLADHRRVSPRVHAGRRRDAGDQGLRRARPATRPSGDG